MFVTSRNEDKKFEVFPEVSMVNSPIYKIAPKYATGMHAFRCFQIKTKQFVIKKMHLDQRPVKT